MAERGSLSQSRYSAKRQISENGIECEFVTDPPKRSQCPICLYVVKDPQQTPCCGKVFCESCISKIKQEFSYCPTCKTDNFKYFPDKGLKQELLTSVVYCSYKSSGCEWQGELGDLEKHTRINAGKVDENSCKFVPVKCPYCQETFRRDEVEPHQNLHCGHRPFTCQICQEYKSTYDDVTLHHEPSCSYRPVECPNKCGKVFHHRKLEGHLSTECELALVDCEFRHAGCEVRVIRRDLPGHLTDNMIPHLSMMAISNKNLQCQLAEKTQKLEEQLAEMEVTSKCNFRSTLCIQYPWEDYAHCHIGPIMVTVTVRDASKMWLSQPFTYHKGHKLQLCVWYTTKHGDSMKEFCFKFIRVNYYPNSLVITTSIRDPYSDKTYFQKKLRCAGAESEMVKILAMSSAKIFGAFMETARIPFCIEDVEEVVTL